MFSLAGPGFSRLPRYATMPSVRLKIEVVGTGGVGRTCFMRSESFALWPLTPS
jgi:hypothetical protein